VSDVGRPDLDDEVEEGNLRAETDETDEADDNQLDHVDRFDQLDDDQLEDDDRVDDDDDQVDGNRIKAATARAVCEFLVRAVVEDPEGVGVTVDDRGRRVSLDVRVSPGDMGRVIGKRGRIAQAIRTVVRAAAVRDGVEVDVEFVE
jgi:uncharacterized protein